MFATRYWWWCNFQLWIYDNSSHPLFAVSPLCFSEMRFLQSVFFFSVFSSVFFLQMLFSTVCFSNAFLQCVLSVMVLGPPSAVIFNFGIEFIIVCHQMNKIWWMLIENIKTFQGLDLRVIHRFKILWRFTFTCRCNLKTLGEFIYKFTLVICRFVTSLLKPHWAERA